MRHTRTHIFTRKEARYRSSAIFNASVWATVADALRHVPADSFLIPSIL